MLQLRGKAGDLVHQTRISAGDKNSLNCVRHLPQFSYNAAWLAKARTAEQNEQQRNLRVDFQPAAKGRFVLLKAEGWVDGHAVRKDFGLRHAQVPKLFRQLDREYRVEVNL